MDIHIGQEIEKKFQESGLKMPVFAERINTGERNVYSLFKRKDISVAQLQQISKVLDFDFLTLYVDNKSNHKEEIHFVPPTEQQSTLTMNFGIAPSSYGNIAAFMKGMNELAERYGIKVL